ncbi:hypothetical protein PLESTF_000579000 [Pleodorina starrii]|nr:hypothetical protein PLESTF_000579000 [Pleodorina starrii]
MGTFIGVAMVIEYSNVFANPTAAAQIIKPLSYHIRRFIVSRPIAVATVDYLYTNAVTGATTNLTFNQWFRFDNYSRVAAADFTIDRFAEFLPALGVQRVIGSNPNFPTLFKTIVCQAAVNYCRSPPLQQYADMQTCMDFLSSIPILDPRRVQSNSVLCRYWHSPLVGFAPEIHCPHIGPSGGDMCMDGPYSAFYTASPFPVDTFALP